MHAHVVHAVCSATDKFAAPKLHMRAYGDVPRQSLIYLENINVSLIPCGIIWRKGSYILRERNELLKDRNKEHTESETVIFFFFVFLAFNYYSLTFTLTAEDLNS